MEKGTVDLSLSPRSTLGWKDDWGYESAADLEPTTNEPLTVGPSHTRSKSLVGLSSWVTSDGPKTPDLQLETLVSRSPARCKSFGGLSSAGPTPYGPKSQPLQLERRLCRSLSPPLSADQAVRRSLLIPESPNVTDGASTPAVQQAYPNYPPEPILRAVQVQLPADERGRGAQPSQLWEPVWRKDRPSARDDSVSSSVGDDTLSVGSSGSSAATAAGGQKVLPPSNRMQFASSLNEELLSVKSCMKRAIDLGKKVQHYGALEVSQLRGEKANAEAAIRKSVQVNRELEQQVVTLRDEVQRLQWQRELEVLSMNNEVQELEMERNSLKKAAREEKKKREKLQSEVGSVLSVLLKEKRTLESEREAHNIALLNEKKKLQTMRKARDAAVKALEEGNKKLEVERDAMLLAMRDLTSRLDFERDAKLRSMRRTSMDMATVMSGLRSSGSRRQSFSFNDDGKSPRSRPPSRQNSRQLEQFQNSL